RVFYPRLNGGVFVAARTRGSPRLFLSWLRAGELAETGLAQTGLAQHRNHPAQSAARAIDPASSLGADHGLRAVRRPLRLHQTDPRRGASEVVGAVPDRRCHAVDRAAGVVAAAPTRPARFADLDR